MIKDLLKNSLCNITYYSGALKLYKIFFPRKQPVILTYHRVDEDAFSKQMNYLKKNYNVIPLDDYVKGLVEGRTFKKNTVVITFDDGYLNNYAHAYPILKKLGLKATVFITYDFVNKNSFAWWDRLEHSGEKIDLNLLKSSSPAEIEAETIELTGLSPDSRKPKKYEFMNWEQIKEMNDVFEIGSHTMTHPILTNVSLKEAEKEITQSKTKIEKKIGREVKSFSYPNGNYNDELVKIVKKAGYKCAVVYNKGVNNKNKMLKLHRRGINIKDNAATFANKTAGVL